MSQFARFARLVLTFAASAASPSSSTRASSIRASAGSRRRSGPAARTAPVSRVRRVRDVDRDRRTAGSTTSADDVHDGQLVGAGRKLWKIQIGSVCVAARREGRDDDLVERQREREQRRPRAAPSGSPGSVTYRNVCHVSAPRSVGRLLGRRGGPPQPGDDVVVDEDDAERRVADDDREHAQRRGRASRTSCSRAMPVTMPGSAIGRITTNEIDLAAEEPVALDGERRERPEDERDGGRAERPPGAR